MAVLVLLQGGQAVPYPLDGDEILIGRHPDCGVQLESSAVSRRHARVFIKDGRYLIEDLGSVLEGELLVDPLSTALYASDASLYHVPPLAVARPRTRDDVVAIVSYAAEVDLGVFARGAGSGVAGGCLGPGIVVDFSRYLHRILSVDDSTVTVEPGVVLDELNRFLRPLGRYLSLKSSIHQPSSHSSVTLRQPSGTWG